MATPFIYTNPEAAKQAIADRQLQAALAENASREAIAREQTQAQRYATQSQISEREKDRQVSRDSIASQERWRSGYGSSSAANDRANTQYQTVLGEIKASGSDPMTKRELEARIASFPQITEDLANNLRSERDIAYRMAKNAYDMGERLASNYRTELAGKKPGDSTLAEIYKRINGDKNVAFDRATGNVQSAFPMPRLDAAVTMSGLGSTGTSIAPAIDYGGAATSATAAPVTGGVTSLDDVRKKFGSTIGAPVVAAPGVVTHVPVAGPARMADEASMATVPPSQAEMLALFDRYPSAVPSGGITSEQYQQGGRTGYRNVVTDPNAALSGFASNLNYSIPLQRPSSGAQLVPIRDQANDYMSRFAPPAQPRVSEMYGPQFNAYSDPTLPRLADLQQPYGPPNSQLQFLGNDYPPRVRRSTDFAVPPFMQTLPRLWDLQNIRPEFIPMDDRYYAPQ